VSSAPRDLDHVLDELARGPFDGRAAREARAVLEELATRKRIEARGVALLARHAALFAALGLDGEVLAVARAWAGRGLVDPDLARLTATSALLASPKAVELRLRGVTCAADADAVRTLQAFMRGDLALAATIARGHGFFLAEGDLPFAYATAYAAWALALGGQPAEGRAVLAAWRAAHADAPPRAAQFVLRALAWLSGLARDHDAELDLVGQAIALCEESELAVERAFVEVELVFASRNAGDLDAARDVISHWSEEPDETPGDGGRAGLLEGYRDLARAELALEERDGRAALASATRARTYFDRCENVVLACDAQLAICLAHAELGSPTLRAALVAYRRLARRTSIAHHLRHVRVLEDAARNRVALTLRGRDGTRDAPLVRLVRPDAEATSADLYLDTARREVWLAGAGPFPLGEHPVVERVLEELAREGGAGLPMDELFTRVWGGSYHPLRHENKVHVTLHRLRQWLDARGGPAAGHLVQLANGVVGLDEGAEVRVLVRRTRNGRPAGLRGAHRMAYAARP
jgi:hypothetical protein